MDDGTAGRFRCWEQLGHRPIRRWRLYGLKFFCSNVGAQIALVLARPEGAPAGTDGLALFLVRRSLPHGTPNRFRIERLKDKLGTRAMATGEVMLDGAHAELVGQSERGFPQMTPMLNITRLQNAVASAALMRRAVMLACSYAAGREAFGRRLDRHPLHREILLEMAVQAEAALVLAMRVAALLGRLETSANAGVEDFLFRIGVSLAKLYTARQAVKVASEELECFGGQGYMEDTGIPRLLRDAQVLPIWEGTTNVLALDVLRLLRKPGVIDAYGAELERLDVDGRHRILTSPRVIARQDDDTAQRAARWMAFVMAEDWVGGLLRGAVSRGAREAAVAERWQFRGATPAAVPGDVFDLILEGAAGRISAAS